MYLEKKLFGVINKRTKIIKQKYFKQIVLVTMNLERILYKKLGSSS